MFKNVRSVFSVSLPGIVAKPGSSGIWSQPIILVALAMVCVAVVTPASAQTFKTIHNFTAVEGNPGSKPLIQGTDGEFYNSSFNYANPAIIFKVTPAGSLTPIYTFCQHVNCANREPNGVYGALVLGADRNFYGSASVAPGNGSTGAIFKLSTQGVFTTLYTFTRADGEGPNGGLIQGSDGNFYTTSAGSFQGPAGTFFKVSSAGVFTTLYTFLLGDAPVSPLVQASDGNFYGDAKRGGTGCGDGCGIIFKLTPTGEFTTLTLLSAADGEPPDGITIGPDGNFYGTAASPHTGAAFEVTTAGALVNLYTFPSPVGGEEPLGSLIMGTDGNLYGTTSTGGANGNYGTIFQLTPSGTLTTLHSFNGTDGSDPIATLTQSTNGIFYGTTSTGGPYDEGTIFSLSMGLAPFVIPQPKLGPVGKKITILGTNLTGTTAVSFNGTPATFMAGKSAIVATVPSGATSGAITVTMPSGTLSSNVVFSVTQ
jgi:uncharacterized repeat protein (TIGR03803 family)